MPIRLKFADDGRGVLYHCTGLITGRDFIEANRGIASAPERVKDCSYAVVDSTLINDFNISVQDIELMADQGRTASGAHPDIVPAVIAPSDPLYGVSRMWELMSGDTAWEKMVFRSKDEARAWLGEKVREKFKLDIKMDFDHKIRGPRKSLPHQNRT